eukprot:1677684-Pyramimonas_sp.AAC.1
MVEYVEEGGQGGRHELYRAGLGEVEGGARRGLPVGGEPGGEGVGEGGYCPDAQIHPLCPQASC